MVKFQIEFRPFKANKIEHEYDIKNQKYLFCDPDFGVISISYYEYLNNRNKTLWQMYLEKKIQIKEIIDKI